ncbi:hypothetical protein BCU70_12970 [Vibrio sp. 10N.286.49.C2]|uniref:hypothetical protein n=1 Tax=unclassified Vibrio TaxID=2614977 RepID=UPI000C857631|nr:MULTISPECIES: hypothetical protein [unclassified Vibrio]PMH39293.1 hypothetical protein BCU70_12970 [Vibrio sp. 10N.286.49.C2]PMH54359.1 hypothetical protein BCU66_11995 [Vibrio sp. 10N.286.49.B1]PMH78470.1 hypothetical protein BCU58_00885 [Vibrio sp. 10N.286.48.B7]
MITSKVRLTDESLEVIDLTATGLYHGTEVKYLSFRDKSGMYVLAKVRGRRPGSRPQALENKVRVESLEEVVDMLQDNVRGCTGYYAWLRCSSQQRIRYNQFHLHSITFHYKAKSDVTCDTFFV